MGSQRKLHPPICIHGTHINTASWDSQGQDLGVGIMQFLKYTRFSKGSIFTETESEANPFMFGEALLTLLESKIETKRSNVERKRRLDGKKGQFL